MASCRRLTPSPVAELAAVLVAARDEERTIARTVELLHTTFPGIEVIVADDGSRDGTAARAEEAGAQVLRLPARGKGQALTLGERVETVSTGPRVGLRGAPDRPWRFWVTGERSVSTYRPAKRL